MIIFLYELFLFVKMSEKVLAGYGKFPSCVIIYGHNE